MCLGVPWTAAGSGCDWRGRCGGAATTGMLQPLWEGSLLPVDS